MKESQEWDDCVKGRNISLTLAVYNLKMWLRIIFGYRGKVGAQLSMVRILQGKPCSSASLLMEPVSQLSFSSIHFIELSCLGCIYGVHSAGAPEVSPFLAAVNPQDCSVQKLIQHA